MRRRTSPGRPGRRRVVGGIAAVTVLVAGAFLGGRASIGAVTDRAESGSSADAELTWEVKHESIGRTLTMSGVLSERTQPGPLANAAGVVTSVDVANGDTVKTGQRLFSTDLRPTVAGEGATPGFRDLSLGDRGADVSQLRAFLCKAGRLKACKGTTFDLDLSRAVTAWQKSVGLTPDGTVDASSIMWLPELPARVQLSKELAVGARMSVDDRPILVASQGQVIELKLTPAQAELVPDRAPISFGTSGAGVAVRMPPAQDASQDVAVVMEVRSEDGTAGVCAGTDLCSAILGTSASVPLELKVVVVPSMDGAGVPLRAILSAADDTTYVILADGTHVPVTVLGTTGGVAIVDGVELGALVRLEA
ncbi:MAG: peptidoglycan-binding protein [Propionibacteriaceae bacterium]|nr:peptidoglycan-binding protein [Propionibacteriaceae bacterium]